MTPFYHITVVSWLILSCYLCHVTLGQHNMSTVKCFDEERKALLQFKDGIIEDQCGLLTSWRDDTDCCQWKGVRCNNYTGHVVMLRLQGYGMFNNCLTGDLSSSLGKLKHLRHLNLNFNYLTQPNLDFLGSLTNLEYLSLSDAFPLYPVFYEPTNVTDLQWLGNLSLLRYLDLSSANLRDAKNWTKIVVKLSFLSVLRMNDCSLPSNISSSISHINSSSNLRVISLSRNSFNDDSIFMWLFNLTGITTTLEHLDLSANCIGGPIPNGFESLKVLSYLDLSWNSIGGPIPNGFESLKVLSYLDLSLNSIEGPIPNGFESLKALSHLDLSHNNLEGPIPNGFESLKVLSYLDLALNSIGGPIPNGSESLKALSHLDLSHNNLEGRIPNGFQNLKYLSHLDFSGNNLEGPIPSEFRNLHSLSYLSLSSNNLQGTVSEIFGLCNLQLLHLGYNNFTNDLTNVTRALHSCEKSALQILDLSENRLWGVIPDTIDSFSLLRELYLDGNQLSGQIPQGIGQLGMLEKLDISSNLLEATLTHTHFVNLSRLRQLYLSDNPRLVINIDASWDPPFQLDIISLRSCKLGPYFPNWLQKQTNFTIFDVSNAEILGSVPASFWNSLSYNLEYLNMSHNQFSGGIPNLPTTPSFSGEVDLRSNLFEGAIPSWLLLCFHTLYLNDNRFSDLSNLLCPQSTSYLTIVDLSNNLLIGELPDCWMNISGLTSLHLENNRLYGSIPKSIGTLKQLQYLHLHNNSFSGIIPASLENCNSLVILNLGYNSFTGNIPPWIGNVNSLGFLILRRNNFVGEIPPSLCQLPHLQILDLAINHISGEIPICLSNLTAMTENAYRFFPSSVAGGGSINRDYVLTNYETAIVNWKSEELKFKESVVYVISIDFSFNELHGEIPDGIFNLTGLVSLDLSKNNLSGGIAPEIGQLTSLQLLDLSDNHLTGEVPASLTKLNFLEILGLSNNNLSGKIPLSTQLQSFNASSYLGNSGLCGDPLPKCSRDQAPVHAMNRNNVSVEDGHHDYTIFPGLYIAVVLGFIIGFWGVCGSLVIKTSWRHAWFQFLNSIRDRFYVIIMGIIAKAER